MDIPTLHWLQSPEGQALLADLMQRPLSDANTLSELTRLRRSYPAEQARAALEQALLRNHARAKFPDAERMFFIREALEQASTALVAESRATRIVQALGPNAQIADVCCGIGGDALAFARAQLQVTGIDYDPLRLAIANANASALGLAARLEFTQRDVLLSPPPQANLIFCDPGRRAGGRRRFHVEEYAPPLSRVLSWSDLAETICVKLAPGVDLDELPGENAEVEFVSLNGELKEALLWRGALASVARRATVLRSAPNDPLSLASAHTLISTTAEQAATLSAPLAYLYEPDPAVIRAGLVRDLAFQLGAKQLDPEIAYLTAEQAKGTPFARIWPILGWLPFNLKRLRSELRQLDVGPVTVKKRGSPLDTDQLARQLSAKGTRELVVVLTQMQGQPIALVCDPPLR